jgi:hypothetical protein
MPIERDARLRPDANDQYQEVASDFRHYVQCGKGSLAPLVQSVGFDRNLARHGIDQLTPQQSQDEVSLAGSTPALDWFAAQRFSTGGRHGLVRVQIFHRTPHLGNPVSNFIDGRSRVGARKQQHPATAEPNMRHLHRHRRATDHRFPAEIISHGVWLYHVFSLSVRDVELILAERGIVVSSETVRQWCKKFGASFADSLRRRRPRPGD